MTTATVHMATSVITVTFGVWHLSLNSTLIPKQVILQAVLTGQKLKAVTTCS